MTEHFAVMHLSCSYNLDALCIDFVWVVLNTRTMFNERVYMSQLRALASILFLQFGCSVYWFCVGGVRREEHA